MSVKGDFENVLNSVIADDGSKYDFRINLKDLKLGHGESFRMPTPTDGEIDFNCTSHSYNQVMGKLGIPSAYARRCPEDVLRPQFDYWREQNAVAGDKPVSVFIRARKTPDGRPDVVRAMLSDRYGIIDNSDMASAFKLAVNEHDYRVQNFAISENMFNARVLFPELTVDAGPGPDGKPNVFQAGIHISNGETGAYTAMLELVIYEQWCTNGAIRQINSRPLYKRRHLGTREVLVNEFHDAITAAKEEGRREMGVLLSSRSEIVRDPEEVLENLMLMRQSLFPESIRTQVHEEFQQRPDPTKYGIVSAITSAARQYDYEIRLDLERFAGGVLERALR